jgi:DMSO/TMAO reductase YedYZ molybdopterin-dependent catalytic subunit
MTGPQAQGRSAADDVSPPPQPTLTLPPGQRRVEGFPRFGTHLSRPAPAVPPDPVITIRGAVSEAFDVPLPTLATLPRRTVRADFHCVAGWSATDLCWEGVPFEHFYRTIVEPALAPGAEVTHLVFRGLDGYRSIVQIADALADDVLLADRLDGQPLTADHGAPLRLLSPAQYGYISTKHLARIDIRTSAPPAPRSLLTRLIKSHPRARVAEEERHGSLPGWLVRPFYRALTGVLLRLCAR